MQHKDQQPGTMQRRGLGQAVAALLLLLALVLGLSLPAAAENDPATAKARAEQAIRSWAATVDCSDLDLSLSQAQTIMQQLSYEPELFYLESNSVWYSPATGKVSRIDLRYKPGYTPAHSEALQTAADRALSYILPGMDDLQKLLVLHDYLALNVGYDEAAALSGAGTSYTAYDALVLKKAVCQGYSLAYQLLLEKCGIECVYVTSDAMNHGWCMVCLGGSWFHVDVTWDDPTPDRLGRVQHDFFLLSDSAMVGGAPSHHGWAAANPGTDARFDSGAFWSSQSQPILDTPILHTDADTLWYLQDRGDYTDQRIQLIRRSWRTGRETAVVTVEDYWLTENGQAYWPKAYSGLCLWDNRLFFNDSRHVYAYDPTTDDWEAVLTNDGLGGFFYGLSADANGLLLLVKTDPRQTGRVFPAALERKYTLDPARNPFRDVFEADYYLDAVIWAYENGVTTGTSSTAFSPGAGCTRAQVATFLWRALGRPAPQSAENPFGDVPENAYYRDAVLWAVEQGITNGTGTDPATGRARFSPEEACTYGHILTFLWRAMTGRSATGYGEWFSEALDWARGQDLLLQTALGVGSGNVMAPCPRRDVVTFLWRAVE